MCMCVRGSSVVLSNSGQTMLKRFFFFIDRCNTCIICIISLRIAEMQQSSSEEALLTFDVSRVFYKQKCLDLCRSGGSGEGRGR